MKAEQLRKSILQLAIQGKLVKQDPNDEPASVLLERIRAEKQRLIKEGKIKKDKGDSIIFKGDDNCHYEKIGAEVKNIEDEIPFEIPDTWCWVRLGCLIKIISGVSYDKKDVGRGSIRILRGGNINALKVFTQPDDVFLPAQYFDEEKQVKQDDILIVASTGSKTVIGKAGYINEDWENTQVGAFLRIVRSLFHETTNYIKFIFATEYYREHIRTLAQGTNINNVKAEYIQKLLIPIPPSQEQDRILLEIQKFEPLLEEYDKLEQEKTKLDGEIYDKLKKSVLQYAIQGKLVEQDENDEPASVLLERIRAEKKAQLGKKYVESYIYKGDDNCYYEKNGKNKPVLVDDLPFDIPDTWAFSRLGNIIYLQSGRDLEPNQYNSNGVGIPYITGASNIENEQIIINRWTNNPVVVSKKGDLLITCKGTIGTMAFNDIGDIHIARQIMAVSSNIVCLDYIRIFLESYVSVLQARAKSMIPGINRDDMLQAVIPIPPLSEQIKIIKKVKYITKMIKDEN